MRTVSLDEGKEAGGRARVLIVDDDREMRALLADVLGEAGYDVTEAADGARALIRLRSESFAAIILDKNMPGLSGLDLLPGLRTICPETPVILITAFGDVGTYVDAMEKGATAYIFKPFRMQELLEVLQRAVALPAPSVAPPRSSGGMA